MKRLTVLLLSLLVVLCSASLGFALEIPNEDYYRTIDGAGLFTEGQIAALEDVIIDSINEHERDLIILTSNTTDGKSRMEYADDFYDNNGYGIGPGKDGILLFICMEDGNRGFWTSACGDCTEIFTEANQNFIDDRFYEYCVSGDFFEGVCDYVKNVSYLYDHGDFSEIDSYYYDSGEYAASQDVTLQVGEHTVTITAEPQVRPSFSHRLLTAMPAAIIFALIVAVVYGLSLTKSMRSIHFAKTAGNYLSHKTLTNSRDIFLGTVITRIPIGTNDNNDHGGGGMHMTHSSFSGGHFSSGGSFHSGGGRSF